TTAPCPSSAPITRATPWRASSTSPADRCTTIGSVCPPEVAGRRWSTPMPSTTRDPASATSAAFGPKNRGITGAPTPRRSRWVPGRPSGYDTRADRRRSRPVTPRPGSVQCAREIPAGVEHPRIVRRQGLEDLQETGPQECPVLTGVDPDRVDENRERRIVLARHQHQVGGAEGGRDRLLRVVRLVGHATPRLHVPQRFDQCVVAGAGLDQCEETLLRRLQVPRRQCVLRCIQLRVALVLGRGLPLPRAGAAELALGGPQHRAEPLTEGLLGLLALEIGERPTRGDGVYGRNGPGLERLGDPR